MEPGRTTPAATPRLSMTGCGSKETARRGLLLGPADIATTQIYTHVDAARLVELVNSRHPLATDHR